MQRAWRRQHALVVVVLAALLTVGASAGPPVQVSTPTISTRSARRFTFDLSAPGQHAALTVDLVPGTRVLYRFGRSAVAPGCADPIVASVEDPDGRALKRHPSAPGGRRSRSRRPGTESIRSPSTRPRPRRRLSPSRSSSMSPRSLPAGSSSRSRTSSTAAAPPSLSLKPPTVAGSRESGFVGREPASLRPRRSAGAAARPNGSSGRRSIRGASAKDVISTPSRRLAPTDAAAISRHGRSTSTGHRRDRLRTFGS